MMNKAIIIIIIIIIIIVTYSEAVAHCLLWFQRTSYDLTRGEINQSYLKEKINAVFNYSIVCTVF